MSRSKQNQIVMRVVELLRDRNTLQAQFGQTGPLGAHLLAA